MTTQTRRPPISTVTWFLIPVGIYVVKINYLTIAFPPNRPAQDISQRHHILLYMVAGAESNKTGRLRK